MRSIVIVHAGMSEESSTARLAAEISSALDTEARARGLEVEIRTIGVRPLAHAIVDHVLTGFPGPELDEAQCAVGAASALVALTPTYQGSYSGLFKAFFDVLDKDALHGTPVLLGATGGTPRHSLVTETAMRPLFTYNHADPVPTAIYAATEDWGAHAADSGSEGGSGLLRRIRRGARELLDRWGAFHSEQGDAESGTVPATLGHPGEPATQADQWPGFTDFETLLGGGR
ncbi:CE1759 family FMN reductase [Actinomyces culturomici]|uniref:CE1759 family FMN reductase n=1 Tax=Actinomyces culturomici TaxID=1926276 RepID=UPI000E1FCBD7|nr:CE1759 family FMN reductase [Actinomyces culturomici]